MFILFIGIVLIGFVLIKNSMGNASFMPKHCEKQHKWLVRQAGEGQSPYICSVCGKIAGEE